MIPQEIYERTQANYRRIGHPYFAQVGTSHSPWCGPDVPEGDLEGDARHCPDAFITWWGPHIILAGEKSTILPVRR